MNRSNVHSVCVILFAWAGAFCAAPAVCAEEEPAHEKPPVELKQSLLHNGDFEDVKDGHPTGWLFGSDGGEADIGVSTDNPQSGRLCMRIKGKVVWAAAISNKIKIERDKTYILTGYVKALAGQALIKFDYFEKEKWIGQTFDQIVQSAPNWTATRITAAPDQFPNATHLVATVAGIGEVNAYFDNLVLAVE